MPCPPAKPALTSKQYNIQVVRSRTSLQLLCTFGGFDSDICVNEEKFREGHLSFIPRGFYRILVRRVFLGAVKEGKSGCVYLVFWLSPMIVTKGFPMSRSWLSLPHQPPPPVSQTPRFPILKPPRESLVLYNVL